MDMPGVVTIRFRDDGPSPHNPLGAKGAGEGGIIAAPAAIANAVHDALRPFGVTVETLPLSPDRVRALLRARRGGEPA
jgi:CO/xanthine dehydrogenase Mo-binding subunit